MPDLRLGGDTLSRAVNVTAVDGDREDIEEVLPGIVDTDCAAIPYAVYRFPLPHFRGTESPVLPEIREVTMSMAGFTVEVSTRIIYAERARTWLGVSCICERLTFVICSLTEAWNMRKGSRHGWFEANFELEDGGCGAAAPNTWESDVVDDGGLATLPVLVV